MPGCVRRREKWNSLQILEHLVLTYKSPTKALLWVTQSGGPQRGTPDLRQRIRCLYVLGIGRFPPGIEAPQHTVPLQGLGAGPLWIRYPVALVASDATPRTSKSALDPDPLSPPSSSGPPGRARIATFSPGPWASPLEASHFTGERACISSLIALFAGKQIWSWYFGLFR